MTILNYTIAGLGDIPIQMLEDYKRFWTSNFPLNTPIKWASGTITKYSNMVASYIDSATGTSIVLTPTSDLNAIAESIPEIAAQWKTTYGFTPDTGNIAGTAMQWIKDNPLLVAAIGVLLFLRR